MPVTLIHTSVHETETADANAALFRQDGSLTLAGQVIVSFLESVDFSDLFDMEGVEECIATTEIRAVEDGDELVESEDEAAEEFAIDEMAGEVAAEIVDDDDLAAMFEHFVNEMPEGTLEEKARKQAALAILGEAPEGDEAADKGAVDEAAQKRGYMSKIRRSGGAAGTLKVKRMIGAMLNKQVIARGRGVKGEKPMPQGKLYKAPGAKSATYTKAGVKGLPSGADENPTGEVSYSQGKPAGLKKYGAYLLKNSGKSAMARAKTRVKTRKSAADIKKSGKQAIYKATGKQMSKADVQKKLAGKAVVKPGKNAGKGKAAGFGESVETDKPVLSESVAAAAGVVAIMRPAAPAGK